MICFAAGPRIVKRNFDPGFFVEHFIKDMGIALDESKRCVRALVLHIRTSLAACVMVGEVTLRTCYHFM